MNRGRSQAQSCGMKLLESHAACDFSLACVPPGHGHSKLRSR
jgi:hypothetical protein